MINSRYLTHPLQPEWKTSQRLSSTYVVKVWSLSKTRLRPEWDTRQIVFKPAVRGDEDRDRERQSNRAIHPSPMMKWIAEHSGEPTV